MSRPAGSATGERERLPDLVPVIPLRESIVYPMIIFPLSIARDASMAAVEHAVAHHRTVLLLAQRDPELEHPEPPDLHRVGTAASILRVLKMPDGRVRLLVQGIARARVKTLSGAEPFLQAQISPFDETPIEGEEGLIAALMRSVRDQLEQVVQLGRQISPEVMLLAANQDEPGRLADLAASNLELELAEGQALLEEAAPVARLERVHAALAKEVELLNLQLSLADQAREELDRGQREMFLRQQLRAIQSELGEADEVADEIARYRAAADERKVSDEARQELDRQLRRLERTHPDSAEASVARAYLDWLCGLPWSLMSEDRIDLAAARRQLERDHYDLEPVKRRILELLAVKKLNPGARGPILCFVGPPGVGKTSLGRSIAEALGRRFVRASLGGIRDEAEIRGHRRTYVGALPGRILQGLHQAGTSNPVFVLDEIDKLANDFRGDPAAALLEVLDPEQNSTFRDHYLGVAYDLSQVLFLTTANLLEPIHPAFVDRLEVLRLPGYTPEEKLLIARRHLLPRLLTEHGLSASDLSFTDRGLREIVESYTHEAGLRNLQRELAALCRAAALRRVEGANGRLRVTPKMVGEVLGAPRFQREALLADDRVGVATGLAWTAVGGDLMLIEVSLTPGKGKLDLTGKLGEVMRESAQAALTFARGWALRQGTGDCFEERDVHVHVPAGAVPKDGPSAGITIAAALVSAVTNRPLRRCVAMTGEITLRGDVLPIGGLKEKVLAARTAGIERVLIPNGNARELAELSAEVRGELRFETVATMQEVLDLALVDG